MLHSRRCRVEAAVDGRGCGDCGARWWEGVCSHRRTSYRV